MEKSELDLILNKACNAASLAAERQLKKLETAGPKFTVHNSDFLGNTGPAVGILLDNCGGAYLVISGKSKLVNAIKKYYENTGTGSGIDSKYEGLTWYMQKNVYKGYTLSIRHKLSRRQEVSIFEEAMKAAKNVLEEFGIESRVHSYID